VCEPSAQLGVAVGEVDRGLRSVQEIALRRPTASAGQIRGEQRTVVPEVDDVALEPQVGDLPSTRGSMIVFDHVEQQFGQRLR
jgi:hypothetical protein